MKLKGREIEAYEGENIVFIVGCPRSGTTWLQRLLSSHPNVCTGQETDLFDYFVGPQLRAWNELLYHDTSGRGGVGLPCYLTEEEFLHKLKSYLFSLMEPMLRDLKEEEIFLEKTPSHALFLLEIRKLLPRARIIHILRDPRDVVASLLAASRSWGKGWAPKTARRAAQMWLRHILAVEKAIEKVGSNDFLEVRYERLFWETRKTVKKAIEFLHLSWSEKEIERAIQKNQLMRTATNSGMGIPVYGEFAMLHGSVVKEPQGFVRRGESGSWRRDLTFFEKWTVRSVLGKKMREKGYGRPESKI